MLKETTVTSSVKLSPLGQMMRQLWPGPMVLQAIYIAANLRIADLLKDGPKSVDELGRLTSTHGPSLRRLLRALASLKIFAEDAEGRFQNTDLSETLSDESAESMRALAMFLSGPFVWRAAGALQQAIETGLTAVDVVYGRSFWPYLTEHPDDAAVFNATMTAGSKLIEPVVLEAYDFSRFKKVVDVGGGHGGLLAAILAAHAEVSGVLYDRPQVVASADGLRRAGLGSRYEVCGGDFLRQVPEGGDAYILKGVLQDWSDDDALAILKNCRRAIRPDGRVLIIENPLDPPGEAPHGDFMDLLMLTLTGGRARTEADFRLLLEKAGFSLINVVTTKWYLSILESKPV